VKALLLTAVLSLAPSQGEIPTRERIEADLAVTISWPEGAPRHRWWRAAPRITVVNRSESTTHRVVKSGYGSGTGLREPALYATVERQDETGQWNEVRPGPVGVCGNHSPNWHRDVVDLAPGRSVELERFRLPYDLIRDDRPHRVTVHYEYRRRPVREFLVESPPREVFGRMGDRPAFHLVSEPSEIRFDEDPPAAKEIERSLRLRLEGIASPARWHDLRASAAIENVSDERAFPFVAVDAGELTMPWDKGWGMSEPLLTIDVERLREDGAWIGIDVHGRPRPLPKEPDWRRRVRSVAPNAWVELSSSRPLGGPSVSLEAPLHVRMRARYFYRALPGLPEPGRKVRYPDAIGDMAGVPPFTLTSDWIEVDLIP
jgi:hypothetical protein